jgi:hypothetical protein
MSTLITKNAQIGTSGTPADNFTIFQPATPDGTLRIGNGNTGITTGLVTLNSAGNLGLGVTPSAWGGGFKSLDLHSSLGASFASTGGTMQTGMNFYFDGSTYRYKGTGHATRYEQQGGGAGSSNHSWHTAPSGTAGNAISFTQAMTLDASGNLGVGTTSPAAKLDVSGAVAAGGTIGIRVADTTGSLNTQLLRTGSTYSYAGVGANEAWLYAQGASNLSLGPDGAGAVKFVSNGSERARINSSGAFIVGGTTPVNSAVITARNMGMSSYNGSSNNTVNTVAINAGSGGGLCIISGVSFNSGASFTRVYAVAVRVSGGATSTTSAAIGSTGEAGASFNFAESGGFLTVTGVGLPNAGWTVMFINT